MKLFRVSVSTGRTDYIVTNDLSQNSTDEVQEVNAVRWKVEEFHRGVKQLLELLPPDINVQLSLFEFGSHALGFVSTCCAFCPFDFVVDFLRSAWVSTRDWWHFSTPFFGYQGKQLTLIQA